MSARPAPVRMLDLANPRFAPEYEPIRAALAALLGEPRTGPPARGTGGARTHRRPRPATGPHRRLARRARCRAPLLQTDARDDGRPCTRGDPTPGDRLLDRPVRDDGGDA